jgi:hypothetical protein
MKLNISNADTVIIDDSDNKSQFDIPSDYPAYPFDMVYPDYPVSTYPSHPYYNPNSFTYPVNPRQNYPDRPIDLKLLNSLERLFSKAKLKLKYTNYLGLYNLLHEKELAVLQFEEPKQLFYLLSITPTDEITTTDQIIAGNNFNLEFYVNGSYNVQKGPNDGSKVPNALVYLYKCKPPAVRNLLKELEAENEQEQGQEEDLPTWKEFNTKPLQKSPKKSPKKEPKEEPSEKYRHGVSPRDIEEGIQRRIKEGQNAEAIRNDKDLVNDLISKASADNSRRNSISSVTSDIVNPSDSEEEIDRRKTKKGSPESFYFTMDKIKLDTNGFGNKMTKKNYQAYNKRMNNLYKIHQRLDRLLNMECNGQSPKKSPKKSPKNKQKKSRKSPDSPKIKSPKIKSPKIKRSKNPKKPKKSPKKSPKSPKMKRHSGIPQELKEPREQQQQKSPVNYSPYSIFKLFDI